MNKRSILVVEDELLIARDIAMQLRELGYEPLGPATTGEEAIDMAGSMRPQIVLMDVHLSGAMDGITAALLIRQRFAVPTVFLSAFGSVENMDRAKLAQPLACLSKPFVEDDLRNAIQQSFDRNE